MVSLFIYFVMHLDSIFFLVNCSTLILDLSVNCVALIDYSA